MNQFLFKSFNQLQAMKRRAHNLHQDQNFAPQKSNSRFWFFGIIGMVSLFIVLQALGIFKTIQTARTTASIDLNSAEYQNRPMPQIRAEKPNPHVDATLAELASEFEGPIFSDIRTANAEKGWGLSDDEAKFYDDMRERYSNKGSNWLGVVKKSYSTYRTVKEAFGGKADVASMVKDAQTASKIYTQLNQQFGISPSESHNFAQSGQAHTLSDWANFVEKSKKR